MQPGDERHCKQRHSPFASTSVCKCRSLPAFSQYWSQGTVSGSRDKPHLHFFFLILFLYCCATHFAFRIGWLTKVICYGQWHSKQCALRRGTCACDVDSFAWSVAPSRERARCPLFEISAILRHTAVLYFADTITTTWSTSSACLFAMPKPGEGSL